MNACVVLNDGLSCRQVVIVLEQFNLKGNQLLLAHGEYSLKIEGKAPHPLVARPRRASGFYAAPARAGRA